VIILLFFPFKTTTAPRWQLRVIEDGGAPVREVNVTEHWQHYLVEAEGHEELRRTTDNGQVDFPERTVRASIVSRGFATLRRLGGFGTSTRSGPYASVVVWGQREYETMVAVYEPPSPLASEIVVHRQR
jgi:hypothetical protein